MSELRLERPSVQLQKSFLEACEEVAPENQREITYFDWTVERISRDFSAYVDFLRQVETAPPPPFVPDTIYWATIDGEYVGRICFRHTLNDFLAKIGGHIGYSVRPSRRGEGIASAMLSEVLKTDLARATKRILLTCDDNNAASIRVIEKNGGVRSGRYQESPGAVVKLHYWINV